MHLYSVYGFAHGVTSPRARCHGARLPEGTLELCDLKRLLILGKLFLGKDLFLLLYYTLPYIICIYTLIIHIVSICIERIYSLPFAIS